MNMNTRSTVSHVLWTGSEVRLTLASRVAEATIRRRSLRFFWTCEVREMDEQRCSSHRRPRASKDASPSSAGRWWCPCTAFSRGLRPASAHYNQTTHVWVRNLWESALADVRWFYLYFFNSGSDIISRTNIPSVRNWEKMTVNNRRIQK